MASIHSIICSNLPLTRTDVHRCFLYLNPISSSSKNTTYEIIVDSAAVYSTGKPSVNGGPIQFWKANSSVEHYDYDTEYAVTVDGGAIFTWKTYKPTTVGKPVNPTPADGSTLNWNYGLSWELSDSNYDGLLNESFEIRIAKSVSALENSSSIRYAAFDAAIYHSSTDTVRSYSDRTVTLNSGHSYLSQNDLEYLGVVEGNTFYWRVTYFNGWSQYGQPTHIDGDTWSFTVNPLGTPDPVPVYPPVRPTPDYTDPWWIVPPPYPVGPYVPPYWGPSPIYKATGGGRWNQQLVVTGDNSVWYESLS